MTDIPKDRDREFLSLLSIPFFSSCLWEGFNQRNLEGCYYRYVHISLIPTLLCLSLFCTLLCCRASVLIGSVCPAACDVLLDLRDWLCFGCVVEQIARSQQHPEHGFRVWGRIDGLLLLVLLNNPIVLLHFERPLVPASRCSSCFFTFSTPLFSLSFSSFPSDTLPPSQAACIPVSSSLCSTSSSSSHLPPPSSPLPCPLSAHDVSVQAFQQIIIISCNQTRSWHQ